MKLVIDIDDKTYKMIKDSPFFISGGRGSARTIEYNALKDIYNGTPLPKGHGRLIDADYLKDVILLHNFHGNNKNIVPYSDRRGYRLRQREVDEGIINATTIIEADKEGGAE